MKLFIFALFTLLSINNYAKETLLVSIIDWCPFICPKDKDRPGFIVEITNEIFKDSQFELKYEITPWSRGIYNVQKGHSALLLSPSKEEAPGLIYHDDYLTFQTLCFWKLKNEKWTFRNINSLDNIRFVIYRDHSYRDLLNEYFKKYKTDRHFEISYDENYYQRSYGLLKKNSAQTFLGHYLTTMNYIKEKKKQDLVIDKCIKRDELWIGITPSIKVKSPLIQKQINERLKEIKKGPFYDALLKKYNMKAPDIIAF